MKNIYTSNTTDMKTLNDQTEIKKQLNLNSMKQH